MTDEELLKLLDSEDPFGYRIPMSLGEPHAELDKSMMSLLMITIYNGDIVIILWNFSKNVKYGKYYGTITDLILNKDMGHRGKRTPLGYM